MNYDLRPLDRARSIKTKLGLLVAVTITLASVLAVVGTRLGVSPWATVPLTVAAALIVTQLLARGMTSPLREMTLAAQRMAQGDYSQRVRATSGDEVGELARAFNRMSATLELVDRHRRDLVANVSHELRTPITALQAVLENLADGVCEPGPEELRSALAQTERLARLVGDLLDLSRVEEGVTPLRVSKVDLAELLDDAVAQARSGSLRYSVVVSPPGLTVPADPDRLHQLLANLLDNAARHSPSEGEIRVAAIGHEEQVHLDVADEGPGIAPAERGLVFERFTTSAAHHSGTGLGLAISRWVVQLHGGTIAVADSEHGCRIQVLLPTDPNRPITPKEPVMSTLTPPAPSPPPLPAPARDTLASFWPDARDRRPGLVVAAAAAGTLAAVVLPDHNLGLGTALVVAAICGTVLATRSTHSSRATGDSRAANTGSSQATSTGRARSRSDLADTALVALLLVTLVLRDAAWITVLCLLAALGLVAVGSTRATSFLGTIGSAVAVPLAGIRGLPWLGRTLRPRGNAQSWLPALRAALLSGVLLLVFGALFASADALFATWVDAITPDITWNDLPARVVLAVFIAGGTLAAAYVGLAPPAVDRLQPRLRPSRRDFEWLAPIGVVNAVFAVFLGAQAAALFGGHAYLQRTTGLTYADYVHEGFGQLTTATVLTLTVVAWANHKALPSRRRDVALGALCLMTIVVVVSALYRMHLYEEAYGFTRLRLLVSVFEGWLGVVVLLVLVAGVVGGRRWLVPLAVRSGAVGLLCLAVLNPDLYIAEHNISRTGSEVPADYAYLGSLSADAWPAIATLPTDDFACATADVTVPKADTAVEWNLSRARARDSMGRRPPAGRPLAASASATCAAAR